MSSKITAVLVGVAIATSECLFAETKTAPEGASFVPSSTPGNISESFMIKWRAAEKDIEILLVGDSLTGNTGGSGDNPAASQSLPGFGHLHWGYLLWDGICANKPVCDRFDSERDGVVVFKTTGDWSLQSAGKFNNPSISGEHSRATDGTWMSDSPDAKIEFAFDADAYEKLNISGGRHPDGAECLVKVAEGDGKLLASIDKETWAEADNYGFAQQQNSENSVTVSGIALHQRHRRLWLKVADNTVKGVLNIAFERNPAANAPDRYTYFWGTEKWKGLSIFVANPGRGGRNIDLLNHNVTDIYDRNPDLVIFGCAVYSGRVAVNQS